MVLVFPPLNKLRKAVKLAEVGNRWFFLSLISGSPIDWGLYPISDSPILSWAGQYDIRYSDSWIAEKSDSPIAIVRLSDDQSQQQKSKQQQELKQQHDRQHTMDATKSRDACKNSEAGYSMEGG